MTPSTTEIERISAMTDPVIRNLQITACYSDLSLALSERTGKMANWCTFATWASRQAGQTIRKEDLQRKIQHVLNLDPEVNAVLSLISSIAKRKGRSTLLENIRESVISHIIQITTEKASAAVARGNKKVFEEIGWQFARFLQTCFRDNVYNKSSINLFCNELRSGEPPDGQQYLRNAFTRYYQSFFEPDPRKIAELRFLANLEIGFHEQTRLQPEIAEAINAATVDEKTVMDKVGSSILLKLQVKILLNITGRIIRNKITEHLMTLTFPPGKILMLGHDLTSTYPSMLVQLENQDLVSFVARNDSTPDSVLESGATDWSDLKERLHYITDLFRCYHETQSLFEPAFTIEQSERIRSGRVPDYFEW